MTDATQAEPIGDGRSAAGRTEHAIEVSGLELTYADGTRALDGIDLSVPRGEFFGFLGPNGAGKTTTIEVLVTLLRPTSGTVRVNGYDVSAERRALRGTVGYMPQETSVDEELTAAENLRFACDAYGVPSDRRADRIDELLDLVDLADVRDTPAGRFSGGMKKRLDAATALVHDPRLVFLDEPTTGLDPKARDRLWDYFERINDEGTTVFLTTQYLREADELCDRLAVVRDGAVVETGSPEALKRRIGGATIEIDVAGGADAVAAAAAVARDRQVLGDDGSVAVVEGGIEVTTRNAGERGTDLLGALRDAGITVTEFTIEEATLDDVFLAIADEDVDDLAARPHRRGEES